MSPLEPATEAILLESGATRVCSGFTELTEGPTYGSWNPPPNVDSPRGEGSLRLRLTPVLDVGSSAVEDNENSGMEYMVAFSSLYIGCGAFSADDANVASEASVMFRARVGLP